MLKSQSTKVTKSLRNLEKFPKKERGGGAESGPPTDLIGLNCVGSFLVSIILMYLKDSLIVVLPKKQTVQVMYVECGQEYPS